MAESHLGKGRYRRKIKSLEAMVRVHEGKITIEREKHHADERLIAHWEREIRAFQDGITQAKKRLGRHA